MSTIVDPKVSLRACVAEGLSTIRTTTHRRPPCLRVAADEAAERHGGGDAGRAGALRGGVQVRTTCSCVLSRLPAPPHCVVWLAVAWLGWRRDRKEGVISRRDLELLLMRHGDRMPPATVAQFLRFVGCDDLAADDLLNYRALVEVVVNASKAASS